jgi:quinol monooxygenase YgiN
MITLSIDLKTRPQKLAEFLQTLDKLLIELRREEGNLRYGYQQTDVDDTKIHLQAQWQSWENLESHLRSDFFTILLGAIRVLCEKPEVRIDDGAKVSGMEIIEDLCRKDKT